MLRRLFVTLHTEPLRYPKYPQPRHEVGQHLSCPSAAEPLLPVAVPDDTPWGMKARRQALQGLHATGRSASSTINRATQALIAWEGLPPPWMPPVTSVKSCEGIQKLHREVQEAPADHWSCHWEEQDQCRVHPLQVCAPRANRQRIRDQSLWLHEHLEHPLHPWPQPMRCLQD